MKNELIQVLKDTFKVPVYLQGTLAADAPYPSAFFTFWNYATEDSRFYDNFGNSTIWMFTVYFYASDASEVNTVPEAAIDELRKNGWIINGKAYDVPSDRPTHTGRAFDALFVETNIKEN